MHWAALLRRAGHTPSAACCASHDGGSSARTGHADSPRQAPCDDGLHHLGREEGEREGHTDRALAAAFADGNLVGAGDLTGEKLLEPSPAARDRLEDAAAILNLHRTQVRLAALRHQDLTAALRRLCGPGEVDRSFVFAVDRDFDPALVERDPMQMVEDQIAVAQLRALWPCRPHRTDHEPLDLRCWNAGCRSWLRLPLQDGLGDVVAVAA